MSKHYEERDWRSLDEAGDHFRNHVEAMTSEGLDCKSDIAAELGWRDMRIAELEYQLQHTKKYLKNCRDEHRQLKAKLTQVTSCPITGLRSGDLFYAYAYPFVSDGDVNYIGKIACTYDGWIYDMVHHSTRVSGRACGDSMSELGGHEIIKVGEHEVEELLR